MNTRARAYPIIAGDASNAPPRRNTGRLVVVSLLLFLSATIFTAPLPFQLLYGSIAAIGITVTVIWSRRHPSADYEPVSRQHRAFRGMNEPQDVVIDVRDGQEPGYRDEPRTEAMPQRSRRQQPSRATEPSHRDPATQHRTPAAAQDHTPTPQRDTPNTEQRDAVLNQPLLDNIVLGRRGTAHEAAEAPSQLRARAMQQQNRSRPSVLPETAAAEDVLPSANSRTDTTRGATPRRRPARDGQQPSTTSRPGTRQPGTRQPGTRQPGTRQPGTRQPGTRQPGTRQPGTRQPGTRQPGTRQPGAAKHNPGGRAEAQPAAPTQPAQIPNPTAQPSTRRKPDPRQAAAQRSAATHAAVKRAMQASALKAQQAQEASGPTQLESDLPQPTDVPGVTGTPAKVVTKVVKPTNYADTPSKASLEELSQAERRLAQTVAQQRADQTDAVNDDQYPAQQPPSRRKQRKREQLRSENKSRVAKHANFGIVPEGGPQASSHRLSVDPDLREQ